MRIRDVNSVASLRNWLSQHDADFDSIRLPGERRDASASMIVDHSADAWRVYYREPGRGDSTKDFYVGTSEAGACAAFMEHMLRDPTAYVKPDRELLRIALERRNCPAGAYELDGRRGGDALVLEQDGKQWRVFDWKDGAEHGLRVFPHESAACRHVWQTLLVRYQL